VSQRTEIWAIIKEVYNMHGETPGSDKQIELVDLLDSYMKGIYKPNIRIIDTVVDDVTIEVKKKGRGRPRKS